MEQFANEGFIEYAVNEYSGMIIRISYQYTRNKADSEDISQEVFVSLLKQPRFDTEEHLKAWIIRVTINKCKNYLKSVKRIRAVPIDGHSNTDIGNIFLADDFRRVFDGLQKLHEKDRNILYLFYYEDYPAKKIAEILRIKESAVFMRLNRARDKLKDYLIEI